MAIKNFLKYYQISINMNNCNKCSSPSTILLRKKDFYCNTCFTTSINHKFRACIGKNKILSKNNKVLLCLSGGPGSTVLLDLVHHGISLNIHKKLRIIPFILHIAGEDDCSTAKSLRAKFQLYNIDSYFVHISDYLNQQSEIPVVNHIPEKIVNNEEFKNTVKNLPITAQNDFMNKVKRTLFIKYAHLLGCKYVFTAETTSTLAINLLSNLAIGRGSQVENDIGFIDSRDEQVKILRPMKDITKEELDNYINIKNLTYFGQSEDIRNNSLQSVISSFVSDLQENFQSTISAVCKTADKIGVSDVNECKQCAICKSNLKKISTKLSALDVTIFSRTISHGKVPQENDAADETLFPFINNQLCYSCSRNYSEMNTNSSPLLKIIKGNVG